MKLPILPEVPGQISSGESRYLYWLISEGYTGSGAIVELGTWLGKSTIHLAAGLRDSGYKGTLFSYDNFIWGGSIDNKKSGFDLPQRYLPYQTCHRRFQQWVRHGVFRRIVQELAEDLHERGNIDIREAFIDGSFAPAKKRFLLLARQNAVKAPRSWPSQTLLVSLSPPILPRFCSDTKGLEKVIETAQKASKYPICVYDYEKDNRFFEIDFQDYNHLNYNGAQNLQ